LGDILCGPGPYTLKDRDGKEIDFMCLTMIDPTSSRFEILELLIRGESVIPMDTRRSKDIETHNTTLIYSPLTRQLQ
jgi:hypothetical protein